MSASPHSDPETPAQPPRAINAPGVIVVLSALMALIQAVRAFLPQSGDDWVILTFAFSPARYAPPPSLGGVAFPGGAAADVWTFLTYALLHGGWTHLAVNLLWMLAFGSLVARRIGAWRFIALSAVAAVAAAAATLALHRGEFLLLVGASGAISGQMAGAIRLIFADGGSLAGMARRDLTRVRALSLPQTLTNPGALVFVGLWLAITVVFGVSGVAVGGEVTLVAWEAHIGGFVAGLVLFGLFDRQR